MTSVRQSVKAEHLTAPPSRSSRPPMTLRVRNFRRAASAAPCLQCGQPTKARLLFVAIGEVPTHMACCSMEASSPTLDKEGRFLYSLRSDNTRPEAVDVSEVAKLFGGGGHKNAAGFTSNAPPMMVKP